MGILFARSLVTCIICALRNVYDMYIVAQASLSLCNYQLLAHAQETPTHPSTVAPNTSHPPSLIGNPPHTSRQPRLHPLSMTTTVDGLHAHMFVIGFVGWWGHFGFGRNMSTFEMFVCLTAMLNFRVILGPSAVRQGNPQFVTGPSLVPGECFGGREGPPRSCSVNNSSGVSRVALLLCQSTAVRNPPASFCSCFAKTKKISQAITNSANTDLVNF
jgi:hypothetical protein